MPRCRPASSEAEGHRVVEKNVAMLATRPRLVTEHDVVVVVRPRYTIQYLSKVYGPSSGPTLWSRFANIMAALPPM